MYTQQEETAKLRWRLTRRLLGQVLVDGGFISHRDLERAVEEQKHVSEQMGEILVRLGALDPIELKAVLSVQKNLASLKDAVKAAAGVRQLLGELLLQAKRITPEQLDRALKEQQRTGGKIGEVLVRLGLLTRNEIDAVLEFQQNQGSDVPSPFRLGEILVATHHITREQLEDALKRQRLSRKKIGEALVEAGYLQPHEVIHGLNLQRKLITAALVAILSMAAVTSIPVTGAGEAAASGSAKVEVTVTVLPRATLKVIHQTQEFIITNTDIQRGYVDVQLASRLEIRNNSPAGYLLIFEGNVLPIKEIHVKGVGNEVIISSGSGWIPQPNVRGAVTLELSYRFILSENAQPGTYAWPLNMSLQPL